jgi:amino acid transporter
MGTMSEHTPQGDVRVFESDKLARNALGLRQVLFCIVTGAAPIAAMQFNVPYAVGGAGTAGPATFLLATVILTVFSVGYIEMARRVTAAGGFYSFISHGFGQVIGTGSAYTISAAYIFFTAANVGVTSYFFQTNVATWTNGNVDIPIWAIQAFLIIAVMTLSYFHVELTAKVLGVFLVTELVGLLVFDVAVLIQGGDSGLYPSKAFDFSAISGNADAKLGLGALAGIAFFGAFWSWVGFEMAPNYAEESRNPKKLMASATYISVVGLGVLYTFTCWMFVAGWGPGNASASIARQFGLTEGAAGNALEPLPHGYASAFYPLTDTFVGHAWTIIFQLLMITGSFACMTAFFNTSNRYVFAMAREGLLPRNFSRTHPSHRSPYHATFLVGGLIIAWVVGFYLYDSSTLGALLKLGTYAPLIFVFGILGIQALCSFAIMWYFWTKARDGWHWWKTGLAPLLGGLGQIPIMYLVNHNSAFLGGGEPFILKYLAWEILAIFVAGMGVALYFKSRDPARYAAIGRYLHEDA